MSRVFVTNDSGPALFAARTGRSQAIWAGLACSPCVNALNNRLSRCRDNVCMQRITVDEVFDATMAACALE